MRYKSSCSALLNNTVDFCAQERKKNETLFSDEIQHLQLARRNRAGAINKRKETIQNGSRHLNEICHDVHKLHFKDISRKAWGVHNVYFQLLFP